MSSPSSDSISDDHLASFSSITVTCSADGVAELIFDRPEKHNAFGPVLIREITTALLALQNDKDVRVLLIGGAGKSFSAGADLSYMQSMANFSSQDNIADAKQLAAMLSLLNRFPKPVIAAVHGNVYGGAVGLLAASDIIIVETGTRLCLSEVRLGLAPAVISPYVIARTGSHFARRYFISAEVFGADTAAQSGLAHEVVASGECFTRARALARTLLGNGPEAMAASKALIERVAPVLVDDEVEQYTCELIARLRAGTEGQMGLEAFFSKTEAPWVTGKSFKDKGR